MDKKTFNVEPITKQDIKYLAQRKEVNDLVLSLYIYAKVQNHFTTETNSALSNQIKKIKSQKRYSEKEMSKILEIAKEIKERIKLFKFPNETRSFALFYSLKGLRKAFHIPIYINSRLVIEPDPYIHPLIKTIENYPRYLVAVLERDKARFFSIFLGVFEEISEVLMSEVPRRINAARVEWKGLSESRVQGHIREHENRHIKKVAEKTNDYFRYREKSYDYLVIGTHKELSEKFINALGVKAKNKLIGSYNVVSGYEMNRIKGKSSEIIANYEKASEEMIVKNLFDKSSKKKKMSALGINSVLEALYNFKIVELVVGEKYKEQGYVCPKCHLISSYLKTCPKDQMKMIAISDIADELMEEAISHRIKIKHLFYPHKKFDKYGIGAFLKSAL